MRKTIDETTLLQDAANIGRLAVIASLTESWMRLGPKCYFMTTSGLRGSNALLSFWNVYAVMVVLKNGLALLE